jgi:hypothetical protein
MEARSQLHNLTALPPGKEPRYPFDGKLGWSLSRSGCGGEEKKSLLLSGIEAQSSSPQEHQEVRCNLSCAREIYFHIIHCD